MKYKRSQRLIGMTSYLLENAGRLISLNYFTEKYGAAKSSISEDLAILKESFADQDLGLIRTHPGATGGVEYRPYISSDRQNAYIEELLEAFDNDERILLGGYIYLTDILSDPGLLRKIGKIIASQVIDQDIDYIMTVASKGIPLAQALAYEINRPIIIASQESKVTEGYSISVKYSVGSAPGLVKTMELARNAMEEGSSVLLIDDFLRSGGTMIGLGQLAQIFSAKVLSKYVLCKSLENKGYTDVNYLIGVEISQDGNKLKLVKGPGFE